MKPILTLLLSVSFFTTVFAQTDAEKEEARRVILGDKKSSSPNSKNEDARDVILGGDNRTIYGGSRYPDRYPTTAGSSRERRINEINREYDAKIYSIRNNRNLSAVEKARIIRQLESDRRKRLAQVDEAYKNDRRYDDDRYAKNKGNNGNHYGWQKGKGNPHKGTH